ncbi:hypothetical protein [Brevundimonas sp.]|uniref:hypothetical protein n=1 Tax=Brevundimonas sp. TaxID=1871086 RepID=UPI002898F528|nr:hypothetical protein [Brevundimonas sp.]
MATLQVRLSDLATRIATEVKALRTLINGNAASNIALITTAKGNLVEAINEVKTQANSLAASGGATINDASNSSATQTYSITKIRTSIAEAQAAVKAEILGGAGAAYDTLQELKGLLDGATGDLSALTTALGNRVRFDAAQSLTAAQKIQGNANLGSLSLADAGNPDTNLVTIFEAGL